MLLQGKGVDGFCDGEYCWGLFSVWVSSYILGVVDVSRGQWCGQGWIFLYELVDQVFFYFWQLFRG